MNVIQQLDTPGGHIACLLFLCIMTGAFWVCNVPGGDKAFDMAAGALLLSIRIGVPPTPAVPPK